MISGLYPAGQNYFKNVGRLITARNQAEEIAGHALLSPSESEDEDD
ncbi:hypothetical protein [Paenarthrobacter sp. NEAU-H11]